MGKLTLTEHLKACAEAAKSFTNGLVAELAQTVTESNAGDRRTSRLISRLRCPSPIPTTGWGRR
ncbi:MAG: hypothetical protein ACLUGP_07570 [Faecalibacterium prausnitzii]